MEPQIGHRNVGTLGLKGRTTPPTPPAGKQVVFQDIADGHTKRINPDGTVVDLESTTPGGGSGRMILGLYDAGTAGITAATTLFTVPIPGGTLPGIASNEDRHLALCPYLAGGTFRRLYAQLYNNLSTANGNLEIVLRINKADTALKIVATPQDFGVSSGPGTIVSELTQNIAISVGQRFNVALRNLATNLNYTIAHYWLELQAA
jgi:hypothetical protein